MIIYLTLLVSLIGLLMYALASNPKLVEIGRICFGFGLLAFLLRITDSMVNVIGR
jgi:Na+/phosphate symporter